MTTENTEKRVDSRQRAETRRPERVPLHRQRSRMTVIGLEERFPDYVFRYVNETDRLGNRLPRLELAGWQLVTEDLIVGEGENKNISLGGGARIQVGLDSQGHPRYAVLMRQLKEHYDADQAEKQGVITDKESQIYRTLQENEGKGFYGNVSVEQKTAGTPKRTKRF